MNSKEWARKEIDLAMLEVEKKMPELKEELNEYYETAYNTYSDFLDRIESLDTSIVVKSIFDQLLKEMPLTPIEDNEEDWEFYAEGFESDPENDNPGWVMYQCKRRPTLFKNVISDPKTKKVKNIKFSDTGRAVCIDINTSQIYKQGIGLAILDEMFPITMPYQPMEKITVFTEEFKYLEDFDTVGIIKFKMPGEEFVDVMRFFKKDFDASKMIEIDKTEYFARKRGSKNRH